MFQLSSNRWSRRARTVVLLAVALLPQRPKRWAYRRLFGYRIAPSAVIGLSLIDVESFEMSEGASIGHGNLFVETRNVRVGRGARIGHANIFRGGEEIALGPGCEVLRLNVVNSIVDPEVTNPTEPRFFLGERATVTEGHKIDFTDRVEIGAGTILAGRHSSLWTHTRQQTRPIRIGSACYVGSEVRIGSGVVIPDRSVVGMGAVVVEGFDREGTLIAGIPARVVKELDESSTPLLRIVGKEGQR